MEFRSALPTSNTRQQPRIPSRLDPISTRKRDESTPLGLDLKVTECQAEREQAFRLVQELYCRTGLSAGDPQGLRVMKHHLLDTTAVVVAKQQQRVSFTATLVGDGESGLPMEALFKAEIDAMRSGGLRLAEVSCLASRTGTDDKRRCFQMLVQVIGLVIQTARRRGIDRLVLAVHPKHAKVYERLFGCERYSEVKQYAAVRGNPAILCVHDFAKLDQTGYPLFGQVYNPKYAPWQLDGAHMTDAEKRYFAQYLPIQDHEMVPMAA